MNGEPVESNWVYGGVFPQNKGGSFSIIYSYDPIEKHTVYADTVGQYTGFCDKNGVKIFEGDILRCVLIGVEEVVMVSWDDMRGQFCLKVISSGVICCPLYFVDDCEIVGNIYDNLELLENRG